MTERPIAHQPSQRAQLGAAAPFLPQLGDLAADTARGDRVGVVVALPGEGAATYHLRPPGGGVEWSAPADATTLRPVQAKATHATLTGGDVTYDHHVKQGTSPIVVHYEDGSTSEATLILTLPALESLYAQVGRILADQKPAPEGAP